ncbi:MAG: adenosylcobinamide-GDP ribazoletransferase [Pseudomonadota bacterium]
MAGPGSPFEAPDDAEAAKRGYTGTVRHPQRKCALAGDDTHQIKPVGNGIDDDPARNEAMGNGKITTLTTLLADWLADLRGTLSFFTRLPMPGTTDHGPPDFGRAARTAPLAGAVVGLVGGAVFASVAMMGLTPFVAAFAAIGATIIVTGGLHEDGLADTADGLGAFDRERRLDIMRDSRIGSYGVLALIVTIGAKAALLAQITGESGILGVVAAMVAIEGTSRLAALYPLHALSPARSDGLAHSANAPDRGAMIQGMIMAIVLVIVCIVPTIGIVATVLAVVAAIAIALAGTRWADHMLGGHTGDIAGAIQQTTVLVMLAAIAAAG